MSTRTVITDDIDGTSGAETISFSLDGQVYEVDLCRKNRTALERALKPYIAAARPLRSAGQVSSRNGRRKGRSVDVRAAREWATANGYAVAAKGRVPRAVLDAYRAAE